MSEVHEPASTGREDVMEMIITYCILLKEQFNPSPRDELELCI